MWFAENFGVSNVKRCKDEIYFLPKYSCILVHLLETNNTIIHLLNNFPVYWNNYFLFTNLKNNYLLLLILYFILFVFLFFDIICFFDFIFCFFLPPALFSKILGS